MSGHAEHDPIDLEARDAAGLRLIPPDSHVALAAPQAYGGGTILRRSYSYDDGLLAPSDPTVRPGGGGALDAGLLFMGYQRDVLRGFLPIFSQLARSDALRRFTTHTGGALVAVPPGTRRPGTWVGQGMFE